MEAWSGRAPCLGHPVCARVWEMVAVLGSISQSAVSLLPIGVSPRRGAETTICFFSTYNSRD